MKTGKLRKDRHRIKPVGVRIPDEIRERITNMALAEERSFTVMAGILLREALMARQARS